MKVIFLDFDGVLNSDNYLRTCGRAGLIIDPSRMLLLKKIVTATDAKIVLSTSWREHWEKDESLCDEIGLQINSIFAEQGMEIFDKTPHINTWREEQILAWLDAHPETEAFAVLDDMFLSSPLLDKNFVRTSNLREGISDEDVLRIISILNGI